MIRIQLYKRTQCVSGFVNKHGDLDHSLDAYWVTTAMMPVTPGVTCIYSGISYTGNKQYAAFYGKDQEFISTFIPNTSETEIKIPKDVYWVRFSLCKSTKINLFNVTLEQGSLNYVSGSNEAGATFTRTADPITVDPEYKEAQLQTGQTYTISTTIPVYQMSLLWYRMTPTGLIYDSYIDTPFTQEIDKYTFTVPTNQSVCEMKVRFYTPESKLEDLQVMLNEGTTAIEYMPPAEDERDDRYSFSFEILSEAHASFRDDLYKYMKETLSPNLTKGDLDIIIKLMCYIFGDLTGVTYKLKDQIDPNLAEEYYLRHLCSVIGYTWNEALTAEQQREAIKIFIEIRKRRGSIWSLKNLISVFGQDKASYYSTSDLKGVKIVEYKPNAIPDANGLYPGDILVEIPQFSQILFDAIDSIRLIGTRIVFAYVIFCGIFKATSQISADKEIHQYFDPAYWGYDPKINEFGPVDENTLIQDVQDWPIVHRVKSAISNFKTVIYLEEKEPYQRGHIWHPAGNTNYKGFLVDDETLHDEHTMYGYGTE